MRRLLHHNERTATSYELRRDEHLRGNYINGAEEDGGKQHIHRRRNKRTTYGWISLHWGELHQRSGGGRGETAYTLEKEQTNNVWMDIIALGGIASTERRRTDSIGRQIHRRRNKQTTHGWISIALGDGAWSMGGKIIFGYCRAFWGSIYICIYISGVSGVLFIFVYTHGPSPPSRGERLYYYRD
ncbi:hypothetical protein BZA05DRAFT_61194 [Tricharina praecox]|uniref:uncharacterized protein n=1 Tax=Tricharina praecox TaxID=43433 RepID=UPI00221F6C23|nr:uncharacterized protein BZA05DRAFT_61194 [Tricharina praecox]KAI5850692.1 hypothetical protein BZA05DRAFT_61194 [Tricharina praecox]